MTCGNTGIEEKKIQIIMSGSGVGNEITQPEVYRLIASVFVGEDQSYIHGVIELKNLALKREDSPIQVDFLFFYSLTPRQAAGDALAGFKIKINFQ